MYLTGFTLPNYSFECGFFVEQKRTCYTTFYPFNIFPEKELETISFEPITIFYGGNGSGKTTLINVIAETIGAKREAPYNKSSFFGDYIRGCSAEWEYDSWQDSTVITSDDVFDYIFDIRRINEGVDDTRDEMLDRYMTLKYDSRNFRFNSLDDYERLKEINFARRHTQSEFIRRNVSRNVPERSNGESAFLYFTHKIENNQVYLLDEPENSLSAEYQMELLKFLEDSARFFNCQFIIATHSPFLLSAKGAKIYDLDQKPVRARRWTELSNVRRYFDFFMEHKDEFK